MATEILVNDGGAPARIIKFKAGEALTAGDALGVTHVASGDVTVNQLEQSDTSAFFVGVALTDCDSGDTASVITGRGVVCRINCDDVNGGSVLMPHASTGGLLIAYVAAASGDNKGFDGTPVAITLEDGALGGGAAGLVKCMIL
jgi:hypothetical protein